MTSIAPDVTTGGPDAGPSADKAPGGRPRPGRVADGPNRFGPSLDQNGPAEQSADRSVVVPQRRGPVRSWPLLVLAAPAAVAVWSGWVGIGQMTGFGEIHPLPGIWGSLHVDTAVTLPVGVEAYAAFALRVWLTSSPAVGDRARQFARWSASAALVLGMAGQVVYHLLAQAGVTRAPWGVTTVVACLPVLVLGMGSALAHLLRSDRVYPGPAGSGRPGVSGHSPGDRPIQGSSCDVKPVRPDADNVALRPVLAPETAGRQPGGRLPWTRAADGPWSVPANDGRARPPARTRLSDARAAASEVLASGRGISRRSLRAAGLRGSNADLGMLARLLREAKEC